MHSDAASADQTDWRQIVTLYDHLLGIDPSPVVAMNRAVAVGEVSGAEAALSILDGLELHEYYLSHAIRGAMLERLGRTSEAAAAYEASERRTENVAEQRFLEEKRRRLDQAKSR